MPWCPAIFPYLLWLFAYQVCSSVTKVWSLNVTQTPSPRGSLVATPYDWPFQYTYTSVIKCLLTFCVPFFGLWGVFLLCVSHTICQIPFVHHANICWYFFSSWVYFNQLPTFYLPIRRLLRVFRIAFIFHVLILKKHFDICQIFFNQSKETQDCKGAQTHQLVKFLATFQLSCQHFKLYI